MILSDASFGIPNSETARVFFVGSPTPTLSLWISRFKSPIKIMYTTLESLYPGLSEKYYIDID
jgi:hypothetical protein